LQAFGWIKYLRKSLAAGMFFAPFGIRPQRLPARLALCHGNMSRANESEANSGLMQ
jgi:hypothetical protein